jgi:hypothetical protein
MALSHEVKASIIIVSGQWSETIAKARVRLNPKLKYGEELKEDFKEAYHYLSEIFDDDIPDTE